MIGADVRAFRRSSIGAGRRGSGKASSVKQRRSPQAVDGSENTRANRNKTEDPKNRVVLIDVR